MKYLFSLNSPYSKLKLFILYFTIIYPSLSTNYVTYISTGGHRNTQRVVYCLLLNVRTIDKSWLWSQYKSDSSSCFQQLISCVTLLSHLLIPVHIFTTCKKHVCLMYIKKHAWSIEMAQWVKLLAYKPDNLSLIPKGIRTNSTKLSSDLKHTSLNHLKFKT